jgi:hypothetical protein
VDGFLLPVGRVRGRGGSTLVFSYTQIPGLTFGAWLIILMRLFEQQFIIARNQLLLNPEKTKVKKNSSQILHEYAPSTAIETKKPVELSVEKSVAPLHRRSAPPQRPEAEPETWRGVFSPTYKWKPLFSQQIKIRTTELPRLKPHVTIDRRTIEGEDD